MSSDRPPGTSAHDNLLLRDAPKPKNDDTTSSEKKNVSSCSRKRMVIGVIVGFLVIAIVGVVVAILLMDTQGMKENFCKFISRF